MEIKKKTIMINLDENLKEKFQIICLKEKISMTDKIIEFIKKEVK